MNTKKIRNAENIMKKMIAYCGLDCEKCDAYIATINNDNVLREKTAKRWAEMNNAPITAEMINCTGCRIDGVKTPFCDSMCEIRQCALRKGIDTCGDCGEMRNCKMVVEILNNSKEARDNLSKAMCFEKELMDIRKITDNKKKYIDLLLLADESEDMVDKYLERGEMFVLNDNGVKAECVVTKEDEGVYELKNIAVLPDYWRKGYGKKLIDFLFTHYLDCSVMFVGTGDCFSTLSFYKSCGFIESHRVKNFFVDNYDHLMFEDGVQLVDMVYLKWERDARSKGMRYC